MGIFQAISEFFESIFNRNSPEVQKRLQIRKMENEIRAFQPALFKNGSLLPNFAEAIRILYINTKPLLEVFSTTIGSSNGQRARRFESQLVLTGFTNEEQKIIASLSYEERKNDLDNPNMTTSQIFDRQHKKIDKIMTELGTSAFKNIDLTLNSLAQLNDLCRFNFVTILQVFDPNYISADLKYTPSYKDTPIDRLSGTLEELYFQINGLKFTNAMANAVCALEQLRSNGSALQETKDSLIKNIKEIAYVINHILTPEKLKKLICYCRQDNSYTPKSAVYKESACQNFEKMMQAKFKSDEQRIKTEMKDENIRSELSQLFGSTPLLTLYGYNTDINTRLLKNTASSFLWILPMQILKTFIANYYTEAVRSLLNDIVIEGFFNNPTYKTEFSADVYAAEEAVMTIKNFEESFANKSSTSLQTIEGYIKDSRNNPEFLKKLDQTINDINNQASKIIAAETNSLNRIYKHIVDLIQDAKKPTSEIISNLKVLLLSSRNKDNTDLLEQQYHKWEIFFKIMKNYVIITA